MKYFIFVLLALISFQSITEPEKKYAVITGASRGIGAAIADELWNNGYSLILISRSINDLTLVKNNLKSNPEQEIIIKAFDITDENSVKKLFEYIQQNHINICVLVNNAGSFIIGGTEINSNELKDLLNVNLIGAHNMIKGVLPIMSLKHSGHIINIGSIAGNNALAGISAYSASKYALRGLNDSLFKELAPLGIKVTSISPSVTDTAMTNNLPGFTHGGKIQTQDIAKTVTFIISLSQEASIKDIEIYNSKMVAYATHEQSLPIE